MYKKFRSGADQSNFMKFSPPICELKHQSLFDTLPRPKSNFDRPRASSKNRIFLFFDSWLVLVFFEKTNSINFMSKVKIRNSSYWIGK